MNAGRYKRKKSVACRRNETNRRYESPSWLHEKAISIQASRHAKTARMNLLRKRITTGRVERISLNGAEKCGGAAVKEAKINLAVNLANTKAKMRSKMMKSDVLIT